MSHLLWELCRWPSSQQLRCASWSMHQLINPGIRCLTLSNPLGCIHSSDFTPKQNPSNSLRPSDIFINEWFMHEINELGSLSSKCIRKVNKAFIGVSFFASETSYFFSISTTTSCDSFSVTALGTFICFSHLRLVLHHSWWFQRLCPQCTSSVYSLLNCTNLFHILFFRLIGRT